jgi:hypothetical protein
MSRNDLRLLWQALRHPNRPNWLLPATLASGFFALEPFNFAIPVLRVGPIPSHTTTRIPNR